jgi:hypothetical protein
VVDNSGVKMLFFVWCLCFAFGIRLLAFCSRTCICYGFLFEVSLQLYFGCMPIYGPRYEQGVSVDAYV